MKVVKRQSAAEATISQRGAINLPAKVLREVGWQHGEEVFIDVIDEDYILLSRKPESLAEALAGRLTHLFPGGEDTVRFLAEERAGWDEFDRRLDSE